MWNFLNLISQSKKNWYKTKIIQFSEKINKNILGPYFFDPKLTWPKLFQSERTGSLRIFWAFAILFGDGEEGIVHQIDQRSVINTWCKAQIVDHRPALIRYRAKTWLYVCFKWFCAVHGAVHGLSWRLFLKGVPCKVSVVNCEKIVVYKNTKKCENTQIPPSHFVIPFLLIGVLFKVSVIKC